MGLLVADVSCLLSYMKVGCLNSMSDILTACEKRKLDPWKGCSCGSFLIAWIRWVAEEGPRLYAWFSGRTCYTYSTDDLENA